MHSMAWEVTVEDVQTVLERFVAEGQYSGDANEDDADSVYDECMDEAACGRVEKAILYYTEFDEQADAAQVEIADILIQERVVQGPNPYKD